jgi:hypothetical protein
LGGATPLVPLHVCAFVKCCHFECSRLLIQSGVRVL